MGGGIMTDQILQLYTDQVPSVCPLGQVYPLIKTR